MFRTKCKNYHNDSQKETKESTSRRKMADKTIHFYRKETFLITVRDDVRPAAKLFGRSFFQ